MQTAIFGGGCFWCTEAVFQNLKGVTEVLSGYTGGILPNPTYREICYGNTGHAEVVKITFDESVISYKELLLVFFKTHDPTTLNRQGNDQGTQYRSVVYYLDETQKVEAEEIIDLLTAEAIFDQAIVTELSPAETFYPAEVEHHNYYNNNPYQPYCTYVIEPKLAKLTKEFRDRLKSAN